MIKDGLIKEHVIEGLDTLCDDMAELVKQKKEEMEY